MNPKKKIAEAGEEKKEKKQKKEIKEKPEGTKSVYKFTKCGTQIFADLIMTLSLPCIFIKLTKAKELEVQCMDSKQIVLTQFKLFTTSFSSTPAKALEKDRVLCFDLATLQQLMKNINFTSLHQMIWEIPSATTASKMKIIIQQSTGKEFSFDMQLLPLEFTEFHVIPNETSDRQKIDVIPKEFGFVTNQLVNLSNQVTLQITDDALHFIIPKTSESNIFGKITLRKPDAPDQKQVPQKLDTNQTFATAYLSKMTVKPNDLIKTTQVSLGTNLPLQIQQTFVVNTCVCAVVDFYLAPILEPNS
jgi:hypothetical protein